MILDNFRNCFETLYNVLGLEVKYFGSIVVLYSGTDTHYFNLIFDTETNIYDNLEYRKNLTNAISYASAKPFHFSLVLNDISSLEIQDLLNQHQFDYHGEIMTNVVHKHGVLVHHEPTSCYVVRKVTTLEMMDTSCQILAESFEVPLANIKKLFCAKYFLDTQSEHVFFLLYNTRNKPVTTAMLYLPHNKLIAAGHYCWSTKKQFRQMGAMSSLIEETLHIAKNMGYQCSLAGCYDTSISLAKKLGFCTYSVTNLITNVLVP